MRTLILLAVAAALPGCGCGAPPASDAPPGDLGTTGLLVDQPKAGDPCAGAWVSASGWFDPTRYAGVLVIGAPVPGYYAPSQGHFPVPTVPVVVRADGRFVAPRVPTADGATEVSIIPLPREGRTNPETIATVALSCTDADLVPATITATPAFGVAPLEVTLRALGGTSDPWEWDVDGDGTFDQTVGRGFTPTHTFESAGRHLVVARQAQNGRYVYATTVVSVATASELLASAAVEAPAAIAVDLDDDAWRAAQLAEQVDGTAPEPLDDDARFLRKVVVADGDQVKFFDGALNALASAGGFSGPRGVAVGQGGVVYVADTGQGRIVRLLPSGNLDPSFGTAGALTSTAFTAPTAIAARAVVGPQDAVIDQLAVLDGESGAVASCLPDESGAWACAVVVTACADCSAAPQSVTGLTALAPVHHRAERPDLPDADGLFDVITASRELLFRRSTTSGHAALEQSAHLRAPLSALGTLGDLPLMGAAWVAGVTADGVVHEWVAGAGVETELRRGAVPLGVSALTGDPYGTWVRRRRAELAADALPAARETGPLVIFSARPGALERRLLPPLKVEGPW